MNELPERVSHKTQHLDEKKELGHLSAGARRLILGIIVTFSLILALICVTQPFNPLAQFIFLMLLWGVALIVRRMPGRFSALMLIVLSLTVSCRYIWWRYTSTLNWDDPVSLVCGLILLFAETYAWIVLVLGYFQVVWPLNRQPVPLPKDMSLWPSVDIFVPTYNEDLNVVKNTIYASLGIDWPKDKLNIWILDDGGREEFRQFAQNVGVKYIARTTHEHAKAGNINNALKYAKGEFVSIFDCDHVPTRSFLQMTMGWFLKEKQLAMMQTPHHFFSLGYTVNAHRRPISSSLLAFGGQKDSPSNTGKKWGGVRADGVGLSLSYDKGEANGVWASLSGDQLTGKNVEDNWRVRWMTGYYYKVINQNNRRVTIGLNNMIWHYDKDLSGYSLGQGGYYSPQEYLSFAIPVMWRERTENWSWELGASGSWSHSRTKTMPRYPLMNLIPTDWQEEAARQSNDGGSSQGFGYTARALLERRVTSNWFVGTAIDIQQAKDYAPSHFLLYVRYSAAGWQGDMDLPPQPLIPYADW
ncbi:cellulose synthase catalytic subunit [Escherichia coli]|nr:cellulose synthase catalytic subunit [Escherichia coli]